MSVVTSLGQQLLPFTLTPGLGAMLTARLLEACGGDLARAAQAPASFLKQIPGFGPTRSASIAAGLVAARQEVAREIELAMRLGVRLIAKGDADYPSLLAELPDAPWILYAKGRLDAELDRFPVAIVGSRNCSSYGLEQSRLFGSSLARAGLTVVSGGARGVDSAAHRGVIAGGGRTIAVLGCGLQHCYPPENRDLFDQISAHGAVVSSLPLATTPHADQFPARNRVISGLSLGVVVIEADERSGALITARVAADDHGREVMALPGRVDSQASRGTLGLLKRGEAMLVTEPADVIHLLESPARHAHGMTHAVRYRGVGAGVTEPEEMPRTILNEVQATICVCLGRHGLTFDELQENTGMEVAALRKELTLLELSKHVARSGSRFVACESRS